MGKIGEWLGRRWDTRQAVARPGATSHSRHVFTGPDARAKVLANFETGGYEQLNDRTWTKQSGTVRITATMTDIPEGAAYTTTDNLRSTAAADTFEVVFDGVSRETGHRTVVTKVVHGDGAQAGAENELQLLGFKPAGSGTWYRPDGDSSVTASVTVLAEGQSYVSDQGVVYPGDKQTVLVKTVTVT
jgi:hypothetical protein